MRSTQTRAYPCIGLYADIDKIQIRPKNQQLYMRRIYKIGPMDGVDGTDYRHVILRVTLNNGEKYAMDITGQQFGWQQSIIPWVQYESSRIRSIVSISPFGESKTVNKRQHESAG